MNVRKAVDAELGRIMEIYRSAQEFMIRAGNPGQWGRSYPDEALIRSDIRDGLCHVICDADGIHGVFALLTEPEPTYAHIEDGGWLNDGAYVTIHRVAGDGQVHGIFRCAAEYCKRLSHNVRVDTHARNFPMQRQLERGGFVRCGIVYVRDGTPRFAYQWTSGGLAAKGEDNGTSVGLTAKGEDNA